jgi:hypothetical protein
MSLPISKLKSFDGAQKQSLAAQTALSGPVPATVQPAPVAAPPPVSAIAGAYQTDGWTEPQGSKASPLPIAHATPGTTAMEDEKITRTSDDGVAAEQEHCEGDDGKAAEEAEADLVAAIARIFGLKQEKDREIIHAMR